MKINDRGGIKWTPLMLPEHKESLIDLLREQKKVPRPILDEQKIDEINNAIINAIEHENNIEFTLYEDGHLRKIAGIITNYNVINRKISIVDDNKNVHSFSSRLIIDAEI